MRVAEYNVIEISIIKKHATEAADNGNPSLKHITTVSETASNVSSIVIEAMQCTYIQHNTI